MIEPTKDPILTLQIIDLTAPQEVEILIRYDGRVAWINVDGLCVFRACKIRHLTLQDDREVVKKWKKKEKAQMPSLKL